LLVSLLVSTQALPQSVWPGAQLLWQCPLTQLCPPGQLRPQPPQLNGSLCALTQAPSQQVWPAVQQLVPWPPAQTVWLHGQRLHWPSQQYCPAGQKLAPQQPWPGEAQTTATLPVGGQAQTLPLLFRHPSQLLTHCPKALPPPGWMPQVVRQNG
jgi:hypothetical protein